MPDMLGDVLLELVCESSNKVMLLIRQIASIIKRWYS